MLHSTEGAVQNGMSATLISTDTDVVGGIHAHVPPNLSCGPGYD